MLAHPFPFGSASLAVVSASCAARLLSPSSPLRSRLRLPSMREFSFSAESPVLSFG